MDTALAKPPMSHARPLEAGRPSPWRRFFGVVTRAQSYRNIGYLLLGLVLGTVWFSVLVTALSVSAGLLVVALLGVPLLVATWYAIRAFANVERRVTAVLLDRYLPTAPVASGLRGNVWVRLKAMSRERRRWRELGYLILRFPVGVATFTIAVVALAVPGLVAYAPISARYVDGSFGDWFWSDELERFASSSPWTWTLVPLGLIMLVVAFHVLDALARSCGRWTAAWLGER